MDFAIGSRIAETRKRAGLAVEELARRARVPIAVLTALENGKAADISTAAIARMARELDVDVSDWIRPPVHASQPSLFFRQGGVPDFFDEDRESVVKALRDARSIAIVDELLGRKYRHAEFSPVEVGAVPFEQGYELARRVRQALGLPFEPLGSISEIIEDGFGVPVFKSSLHAAHLVALTAKERASNHAAVIVNANFPGSRRVDLAHELAHALFDEPRRDIDYWLDLENDHERETSRTEQRAKAFAAEFLIPRLGLIRNFGHAHDRVQTRSSLEESRALARRVGEHFRAPPELTTNHLVNNMYIAENLREEVWKSIAGPLFNPPPRSQMLHRRLTEALGAGLITQMRARELLGLSARDPLPATVNPEP
jgi:Zn-dependent peptidase ImmA (M78 family)/transcriptional regulator with XRE-family HTH domain